MNLNIDNESVTQHIRATLQLADDVVLLVGGLTVTQASTRLYKIQAHIKVVPPALSQGPYTQLQWVAIRYLTNFKD